MFRPADQAVAVLCLCLTLAACGEGAGAPDLPHAPASLSPRFYAPRGWAWGSLTLADGTALRYGVASPPVVPHGQVLLLPDRNEPAEVWFETANALLDQGYTVWALEGAGGRRAGGLDPSNSALQTMIGGVIRPHGQPLVIAAQGLGATLALRALGEGKAPSVSGAVLASPRLELAGADLPATPEQVETAAEWASRLRMGWIPLPGDGQPRLGRTLMVGLDAKRAGLAGAWRRSDPSLKPRSTTLGWVWGYDQAIRLARAPSPYAGVTAPVVMAAMAGDELSARACGRLPTCTLWAVPTTAPHLAPDAVRTLWLEKVVGLLERGRPIATVRHPE